MRGTQKHTRAELKDAFEKLNAARLGRRRRRAASRCARENLVAGAAPGRRSAARAGVPAERVRGAQARRAHRRASRSAPIPARSPSVRLARHLQPYPDGHPQLHRRPSRSASSGCATATLEDAQGCYRDLVGATGADFAAVGEFDAAGGSRARSTSCSAAGRAPRPFARVPSRYFDAPPMRERRRSPPTRRTRCCAAGST